MKLDPTVRNKFLDLDEAQHEFMLHQRSAGHSQHTINHYTVSLRHLTTAMSELGIEELEEIRPKHLRQFFVDLQAKFKPKTAWGIASDIRAFFNFHQAENDLPNPMSRVELPKVPREILPAFTQAEVQALMKQTEGKDAIQVRNRALLLTLLDSGIRLCELQGMKVGDIDMQTGVFKVMGKGSKERLSRLGHEAQKAMLRYMRIRQGKPGEPLWVGVRGPMTRLGLAETIEKLGRRANVHAHPHKFRRTCALTMLRSGADVFSVQYLLGHSDLDILKRYVAQTQTDYLNAHERFSAVQALV